MGLASVALIVIGTWTAIILLPEIFLALALFVVVSGPGLFIAYNQKKLLINLADTSWVLAPTAGVYSYHTTLMGYYAYTYFLLEVMGFSSQNNYNILVDSLKTVVPIAVLGTLAFAWLRRKKLSQDRARCETALEALCEHLRRIGLNATVESKAVRFEGIIGSVRVANRNIDLIELEKVNEHALIREKFSEMIVYDPDARVLYLDIYRCNYLVQAKVDGLEDKLKAKAKPVTVQKDPKSWEVVGVTWEGGELAQVLNSDANLRDTLSHMKDRVLSFLEIRPDSVLERVRIGPTGAAYVSPKCAFPTAEAFEAYDRIAQHIRSIANVRP